jgi:formylglycine-generating enzyme required for sulfatase activity
LYKDKKTIIFKANKKYNMNFIKKTFVCLILNTNISVFSQQGDTSFLLTPAPNSNVGKYGIKYTIKRNSKSNNQCYVEKKEGLNLIMKSVNGGILEINFVEGSSIEEFLESGGKIKPEKIDTVEDFYIGESEITNEQYCKFLNIKRNKKEEEFLWIDLKGKSDKEKCRIRHNGKVFEVEPGFEKFPVNYISWYGANAFCEWIKSLTGKPYRLPTFHEWEISEMGNQDSIEEYHSLAMEELHFFPGSKSIDNIAWYSENSGQQVHQVKSKCHNGTGIYDLSGNVWEWVNNVSYHESTDSNWNFYRDYMEAGYVGGSWNSSAYSCSIGGSGNFIKATDRSPEGGFRILLEDKKNKR